ncbi:MAG: hypothetical protein V7679_02930 [Parasphingorhabdus sp.]
MIKIQKKALSQREKELFLGNLVTWGSLVSAVILAIAFAPLNAAESDRGASTYNAVAAPLDMQSNQG